MSFVGKKLAGNGQMDLRLMILKKFGPQGYVSPHPGAISQQTFDVSWTSDSDVIMTLDLG